MSDLISRWYVLLPCSQEQSWVLPRSCLGEIVTVATDMEQPPEAISWRGEVVPVMDFGRSEQTPWREPHGGTGLIAVLLGLSGEPGRYWGVAVRGDGLGVSTMQDEEIEDLPDAVLAHATAAFRMRGTVYQVPDLPALQRALSSGGYRPLQRDIGSSPREME